MSDDALLQLARDRHRGVLVTLKRDGRPQLSNIGYALDGQVARISVTEDRAKTKNLRRDPRASLYVTSEDFWAYAVLEGDAELSETATTSGDATCLELLRVYEEIRGEAHPDPDEFSEAMVREKRLVVRLQVERAYGQGGRR